MRTIIFILSQQPASFSCSVKVADIHDQREAETSGQQLMIWRLVVTQVWQSFLLPVPDKLQNAGTSNFLYCVHFFQLYLAFIQPD